MKILATKIEMDISPQKEGTDTTGILYTIEIT